MITKLVILDRDGTINHDSDEYVKTAQEWTPMPGALEAIARLNHAGWHVVVASNQSGLGRGLFDVAALNAMHAKMHKMLGAVGGRVDAVFSVLIAQMKTAAAVNRLPACSSKSASAMAWISKVCPLSGTICAIYKLLSQWVASRTW